MSSNDCIRERGSRLPHARAALTLSGCLAGLWIAGPVQALSPPPPATPQSPELRIAQGRRPAVALLFLGGCLNTGSAPVCVSPPPVFTPPAAELRTPGAVRLRAAERLDAVKLLGAERNGRPVRLRPTIRRTGERTWRITFASAVPNRTRLRLGATFATAGEASYAVRVRTPSGRR